MKAPSLSLPWPLLSAQHPGYWDYTWLSLLSPTYNHPHHLWGTQLLLFNSSLLHPRNTVTFLSVSNFQNSLTGYIFLSPKIGLVGTCPIRFKINNNNSITKYWENIKKNCVLSDILVVFSQLNGHIDMISSKKIQASFGTSLRVPIWHRKGVWRLKNDFKMEKEKKTKTGLRM